MVASTATFINGGEVIELIMPELENSKKTVIYDLEVIYEDEFLAVINKPAGILVSGNKFLTIDSALPGNLKPSNQPDAVKPHPVHRLDYPTTGLLLIGKTRTSIFRLNKMFENKKVAKTYFAVAIKRMESKGSIELPVDGKKCLSLFEVEHTVVSPRFEFLNLVKLTPKTGRRHQLRKHLSELGNPILGDKEYGLDSLILNGKGLYLHAYSLEFAHPFTGETMSIKKDLPPKFIKLFKG